jgi:tetratricopeptide (TPR) repeat protein
MATSHYKINQKDLKAPDELVTLVDRIGNYLVNNLTRVIIGAAALVALAAVIFTYAFYRAHQQAVVANQFYDALTALNRKEYKTAEEGFDALAQTGSGKLASLARLYVASAYMSENKPAQARDALAAFVADSNQRYFKNLALVQLGVAYENLGDFKKAHETYVQAVATPGPEKSGAELGVARTLIKLGDNAGAIAAYRSYLTANPFSPYREEVTESLAALGASTTATSPASATPVSQAPNPAPTPAAPSAQSH